MRAAAVTALLLFAFLGAPARGQDGGSAPLDPGAGPPATAPAAPGADAKALDADFEPEARRPSIALGPNGRGDFTIALDVGWLESGVGATLGLGGWFDLTLRADTLLLYDGFSGQSGIHLGVRISPVSEGLLRAGVELSGGQLFSPEPSSLGALTTVGGQATVGAALDWATFYGRAAVRGISGGSESSSPGWTYDEQVGLGVERTFRKRFIVGAEGYLWARPGLSTLAEWRLRFGYAR
ncbi:MAG TPA: hypothetical protein VM753_14880 [Anaeromyxobacter sp.]|nr:hypothetical protein [Anaeromyxobacter sp.]